LLNRLVYISDFFANQVLGGGELNDEELLSELKKTGAEVIKMNSHMVSDSNINVGDKVIVSNFINLSEAVKDKITANCSYIIYEHDHKYLANRNPAEFKDFVAPDNMIVNKEFYRNAKAVFCQSSFHDSIVVKNLSIDNTFNVSGNLWSKKALQTMRRLSNQQKIDCYSILLSQTPHKNTGDALNYCKLKNYDYKLISSPNYEDFLKKLSGNDKFLFLPKTPETLSRIVVEAKMMGVKVITNKNVGASYEDWFNLSGEELINFMDKKRSFVCEKVLEFLSGK
jgi:hypothetical protein